MIKSIDEKREEGREEWAAWSGRLGVITKMEAEKEVIH